MARNSIAADDPVRPFDGEADDIEENSRWVPNEFGDEDEFHQHVLKLRQNALDADRLNRYAALDDLQFVADFNGMQWDESVRAARQSQGRPCITTNVLPQFIGQVVGDMTINKPAIKVRAAEDGDKDVADIREGLIRAIQNQSDAQRIFVRVGTNQVSCGIGNFKVALDYSNREVFDQDIFIREIPNPLAVIWDPGSIEITGKDAMYCFVDDLLSLDEFKREWPDVPATPVGDELPVQDIEGWYSGNTIRISEYWAIHEEPATIAMFTDGSTRYIDPDEEIDPSQIIKQRETTRRFAVMYLMTGAQFLDGPYRLPIDRLPIFRATGREVYVSNNRVRYGLTRFIKDQQRLKNYADSQIAEFLSMAPRAQWIADEIAVEGRQNSFRNAHMAGDPLLEFNAGGQIQRVDPPPFPTAFLNWSQQQSQAMKDASGLHDASLGIRSNETSGKAILARQQEGDVAVVMYHDNLNAAISEAGRVINDLIGYTYDTMRTIRIVGEDDAAKVMQINNPNDPDSPNLSIGNYDVWVETGPSYSTKRMQAAESMIEFMRAVPQSAMVIGDLIAKAMDWPDSGTIADRLKASMPPEISGAGEEPSQEQMQQQAMAAQQAQEQQQLQQMAIALDMRLKEAQVQREEAEAQRAQAEAMRAYAEASAASQGAENRKTNAEAEKAEAQAAEAWARADLADDRVHIDRAVAFNKISPPVSDDWEPEQKSANEEQNANY